MANYIATHNVKPDKTFIIDLDPQVAADRRKQAGISRDRLEIEKQSFHHKVRNGYLKLANEEPCRIKKIDGNNEIEEISKKIWHIIESELKNRF